MFKTLEDYNSLIEQGLGTKLGAIVGAVGHFLKKPNQAIPRFHPNGTLLPDDQQPPPYSSEPPTHPDKILLYSKFTKNFSVLRTVSGYMQLEPYTT